MARVPQKQTLGASYLKSRCLHVPNAVSGRCQQAVLQSASSAAAPSRLPSARSITRSNVRRATGAFFLNRSKFYDSKFRKVASVGSKFQGNADIQRSNQVWLAESPVFESDGSDSMLDGLTGLDIVMKRRIKHSRVFGQ